MRAPFSDWAVEDRLDFIVQIVLASLCGLVALLALVAVICRVWWHTLTLIMMLTMGAACMAEAVRIRRKYENLNI